MRTKIIEATQGRDSRVANWGKFLVGRLDVEWLRTSRMPADDVETAAVPLLLHCGWHPQGFLWVLDLQTGEGAYFQHRGVAKADLEKHRIWVCPMFEPFLAWLYKQDLTDLDALPDLVELPEAEFEMYGHRRRGPEA